MADSPPVITAAPASQAAVVGTNVTFNVTATGTPPLTYQWRFNGSDQSGATNVTLTLTNVTLLQSGAYSVVVSNTAGSVTNAPAATLTVTTSIIQPPAPQTPAGIQSTGFVVDLVLEIGRPFRVQASTNLFLWADLANFTSTGQAVQFVDTSATNRIRQFYRIISP